MDLNAILPKSSDPVLARQLEEQLAGVDEFIEDVSDRGERRRKHKRKEDKVNIRKRLDERGYSNRKIKADNRRMDSEDEYEDEYEDVSEDDARRGKSKRENFRNDISDGYGEYEGDSGENEYESECERITDRSKIKNMENVKSTSSGSSMKGTKNNEYIRYNPETGYVEDKMLEVPEVKPFPYKIVLIVVSVIVLFVLTGFVMYKLIKKQIDRNNLKEANRIMKETVYGYGKEKVPLNIDADDVYTNINEKIEEPEDETLKIHEIQRYMKGGRRDTSEVNYKNLTQASTLKEKLMKQIAEEEGVKADTENNTKDESEESTSEDNAETKPQEHPLNRTIQIEQPKPKQFWYYRWRNKNNNYKSNNVNSSNVKNSVKSNPKHGYINNTVKKSAPMRDARGRFISKK